MNIQGLKRLDNKELGKVAELLSISFREDPLFINLIPDKDVRQKLVPLYFKRYLETMFPFAHAYADSERIDGVIIFYDDMDQMNRFSYFAAALRSGVLTAWDVVKCDPTLKTARVFLRGLRYLKSSWVHRAVKAPTVHIDFLAVHPEARGKGLSTKLMAPVLQYAQEKRMSATLETHNPRNVGIYRHFGFHTVMELCGQGIRQYCMVK